MTKQKPLPKKYQTLAKELDELFEAVRSDNLFVYLELYYPFQEKYFNSIGEDHTIDFNLVFNHLARNPETIVSINASLGKGNFLGDNFSIFHNDPKDWRGLIRMVKHQALAGVGFNYVKEAFDYHYQQRDQNQDSDVIQLYIKKTIGLLNVYLPLPITEFKDIKSKALEDYIDAVHFEERDIGPAW